MPKSKTAERLQNLVQKAGVTAVAQILQAQNPWRQLKALASKPGQVFRLVLPEELEEKIREKASNSFGAAVPEGGRKKRRQALLGRATPALSIDPELLGIADGSFVATDGQTMHQIKFSEVATEAHGLAFCTAAQAAPFLQGASLSTDPLCLVTTASLPSDIKAQRPHKVIRFPAIFQPADEPLLLTGSLVNLGDMQVDLAQGSIAEPTSIATGVCKISVFRDELPISWDKFCEGPVRWLMQTVPALKVCSGVECGIDCAFFHPAVDEHIDQMVLDLWARQFQTHAGKKVQDKVAEVFSVLIRVPQSAVDQLQMIQIPAVYVEPRADAGVGTHDDYRAIWIANANKESATHLVRTCAKALAVIRLGTKFGVRVREADEEVVFKQAKPGVPFIKAKVAMKFKLHPLPHGTQRSDIIALLREWRWVARPLQPGRGDGVGATWLIGAESNPPLQALPTGDGFAIATRIGGGGARAANEAQVYASQRTKQALQQTSQGVEHEEDPWIKQPDPWALYKAAGRSNAAPKQSEGQSRIQALETSLKQSAQEAAQQQVESALQGQSARTDQQVEARFQRLEASLQEVVEQNGKFANWVDSVNGQMAQTAAEVKEVQVAVSHNEVALQNIGQQMQAQVESTRSTIQASVHQSFQAMQAGFAQQMQSQFQSQMEQFQSLLAKRKLSE